MNAVWQGHFRLHRVKSELKKMGKDATQLLVDSSKVAAAAQHSVCTPTYLAYQLVHTDVYACGRRRASERQWKLNLKH